MSLVMLLSCPCLGPSSVDVLRESASCSPRSPGMLRYVGPYLRGPQFSDLLGGFVPDRTVHNLVAQTKQTVSSLCLWLILPRLCPFGRLFPIWCHW